MPDLCDSKRVKEPKENILNDTKTPIDVASGESSHNNENDSDVGVGNQEVENALNDNQQNDQVVERSHSTLRNSHY